MKRTWAQLLADTDARIAAQAARDRAASPPPKPAPPIVLRTPRPARRRSTTPTTLTEAYAHSLPPYAIR